MKARWQADGLAIEPVAAVFHEPVRILQRRRATEVQLIHLTVEALGKVRR